MRIPDLYRLCGLLVAGLALTGCLSGGGGSQLAEGGMSGTGISYGRVTGIGSVEVNGTLFNTDDALVRVNGREIGDSNVDLNQFLERNMLVRVEGEWQGVSGTASSVEYSDDLVGPLEGNVDTLVRTMTVFGQQVRYDRDTDFRDEAGDVIDPAALQDGDALRISGWVDGQGMLRATYVSRQLSSPEYRVTGVVRNLQEGARVFEIGGLRVSFDYPVVGDELLEGSYVTALGSPSGYNASMDTFQSSEVIVSTPDRIRGDRNSEVEFEGTVLEILDANNFIANGVQVEITGNTEFDDLRRADLVVGIRIEVEGRYNTAGDRVIAEEIELLDGDSELQASIEEIEPDGPNSGWLQVGGVRVRVTGETIIEDDDDDGRLCMAPSVGCGVLQRDDYVEVEGWSEEDADGRYLRASYIERDDDDDDEYQIEARLDADAVGDASSGELTILGLVIRWDNDTEFDDGLDPADLKAGDRVEIEYGDAGGGGYLAEEIERED